MPKTSVFYYTNNVAPPKLLEHSFRSTIKHCKDNNCELIVTSHFPLTQSYSTVLMGNQPISEKPIHQYIVTDLCIADEELGGIDVKSYVVGRLPYAYDSIIKQILFMATQCSGDNIVLMEHDVLYPKNYISSVERFLNSGYNLTYCFLNNSYLNHHGYFNIQGGSFVLSMCSFKKDIFKGIYERKMELLNNNKPFTFEPILDIATKQRQEMHKEDFIVQNHICIDTFLKDGGPLDIKHHLNSDGMLISDIYYHNHPYWGNDQAYIDMINLKIDDKNQNLWNYGISKFNY